MATALGKDRSLVTWKSHLRETVRPNPTRKDEEVETGRAGMQAGRAQHECRSPSCIPSPQVEAQAPSWVLVLHCVSAYLILTCLHHQTLPREQGPALAPSPRLSQSLTCEGHLGKTSWEGRRKGRRKSHGDRKSRTAS